MITFHTLNNVSFDNLFIAFSNAFSDYEFQIGKDRLANMLQRRGYDPAISFGAFDDDNLVAFTLNGSGLYNGHQTVYDTGTGTTVKYRGQGLAGRIFEHAEPILKKAGFTHYLLEVLTNNTKAYKIYEKIGFHVVRELDYFFAETKNIKAIAPNENLSIKIKPISLERLDEMTSFHDFTPSWQNSTASLLRIPEDFTALGAFIDDKIVGYIVFVSEMGELVRIAIDKTKREQGIGSKLFREMMNQTTSPTIKVINVEKTCKTLPAFFHSLGMPVTSSQYEMIKKL